MKSNLLHHSLLKPLAVPVNLFLQVCMAVILTSCAKGSLINQDKGPLANDLSAKERQARLNLEAKVIDLDYQSYEKAIARGDLNSAEASLQRLLNRVPGNIKAVDGLKRIERMRSHEELITQAETLVKQKDMEAAKTKLRVVLTEDPDNDKARKLLTQINNSMSAGSLEVVLSPAFHKPISIDFQDANLKQIFTVIGQTAGLNFIFDKDVKLDQKTTITLKNSTVEAAIYSMLTVNQLEQQIMDSKTVMIYPNNPAKIKEYQQTVVKSFMLTNARAKGVAESLKTILKSREVVVDEKLNMLIVRDSPEALRLIEKIIALQDFPEPEVILELEVLEVSRDRMMNLGITPPGTIGLTLLPDGAVLSDLARISQNNIKTTIDGASIKAIATESDVDTLASPRIRVINREKAKILIGKKLPTYTVTTTPQVGATAISTPLVTYIDVGLKLEVEPTIFLNGEVAIKVSLEVTNIVGTKTICLDTILYTVGNRNASTTLRLKDGENQILAGLINNDTDRTVNKLPGLGDTPLLGKLFGSQANTDKKTEILLSITPRLVRNLQRQEASVNEFLGGTDSNLRLRPDFKVGALEEILSNPAINREPLPSPDPEPLTVPVPAAVTAPNPLKESAPLKPFLSTNPEPVAPADIQSKETGSVPNTKENQTDSKEEAEAKAEANIKAKADEKKLKDAEAAAMKKQLIEQKKAETLKAKQEKDAEAAAMKKQLIEQKKAEAMKAKQEKLDKKRNTDTDKSSPEIREFIDKLLNKQDAP
jgi:general secretion pathway protein D